MKIGIIGSGVVAQTLGTKLVELGNDVVLGTRDPGKLDDKKDMAGSLREWMARTDKKAKVVSFNDAAAHGELLISATHGQNTIDALQLAGADTLGSKVLIDIERAGLEQGDAAGRAREPGQLPGGAGPGARSRR